MAWAGDPVAPHNIPIHSPLQSAVLPLSFEVNQGQVDNQVKYLVRGRLYNLLLCDNAAEIGLKAGGDNKSTAWLRLSFQRATADPTISGEEMLPGISNYFIGNDPAQWRTNIPNFARVRYQQIYPGVDLIYYGSQGKLENDFEVAPEANPKLIVLKLEGADHIRVDSTGDLVMSVGGNEVRFEKPRAYQPDGDQQTQVPIRYKVHGQKVSFALGKYNRHQKLVIDPVLIYSTFLGGTGGDIAYGLAVDSAGDTYVAGVTASVNFPVTTGAYQTTNNGGGDVFVTKLNPTASGLIFSTFVGGGEADTPSALLLDGNGNIYVVGSTASVNFPTTSSAYQTTYGGGASDAFLFELKPNGASLIYSTYLGGSGADYGTALALDSSGDVFLTGYTESTNFPTQNPLQLGLVGTSNAFVSEIKAGGSVLLYSTYLGGSTADYGTAIAVDFSGNVYVGGYTFSTNFPTQNAYQSTIAGGSDAFVTELHPGSPSLIFSTYFGGSGNDTLSALALDAHGNIYLGGDTQSKNFPVTPNAFQSVNQGTPTNTFITKFVAGATTLVFSTLFGGSGVDHLAALTLDSANNIYLTGFTQSSDFPQIDAFQKVLGISGAGSCGSTNLVNVATNVVCPDAFVAKLDSSGTPIYSSFLGGSNADEGEAIVVDSSGTAYVAGYTLSPNFPATLGVFQWSYLGGTVNSNAFVAKIAPQDGPSVALSPQQISFGNQAINIPSSPPVLVTLTNEGSAALAIQEITVGQGFAQTNNCGTQLAAGGSTCTVQVTFTPTQAGQQTGEVSITDNAAGSPHYITLTGSGVLAAGSLSVSPSSLTFAAQPVTITSGPQTVLIVNNGTLAVNITNIAATGFFEQTNTCGTLPLTLNVGASCQVNVTFTPNGSGNYTGTLTVTSDAANSTATVNLSGTGIPEFTLSASTRSSVVIVGTTSTTFTVSVSAPSSFIYSVALACGSTGGAASVSCDFSPASVPAGQTSIMTVKGLSATTPSPLNLTVTGTYSNQTASVSMSVFIADFSLSSTPLGTTVTAGNNATYTITATPTNGFNQAVLLSCSNPPQDADCYFNPPALSLNGTSNVTVSSQSSTLTITTEAQSRTLPPPRALPPGWKWWVLVAGLGLMTWVAAGFSRRAPAWLRLPFRLAVLGVALSLLALGVACQDYYYNPVSITPYLTGTPSGNYTITIIGTLGSNNSVTRTTTINLLVAP